MGNRIFFTTAAILTLMTCRPGLAQNPRSGHTSTVRIQAVQTQRLLRITDDGHLLRSVDTSREQWRDDDASRFTLQPSGNGEYVLISKITGSPIIADDQGLLRTAPRNAPVQPEASAFRIVTVENGIRLRMNASGRCWHEDGEGDCLVSIREDEVDEYTVFRLVTADSTPSRMKPADEAPTPPPVSGKRPPSGSLSGSWVLGPAGQPKFPLESGREIEIIETESGFTVDSYTGRYDYQRLQDAPNVFAFRSTTRKLDGPPRQTYIIQLSKDMMIDVDPGNGGHVQFIRRYNIRGRTSGIWTMFETVDGAGSQVTCTRTKRGLKIVTSDNDVVRYRTDPNAPNSWVGDSFSKADGRVFDISLWELTQSSEDRMQLVMPSGTVSFRR